MAASSIVLAPMVAFCRCILGSDLSLVMLIAKSGSAMAAPARKTKDSRIRPA